MLIRFLLDKILFYCSLVYQSLNQLDLEIFFKKRDYFSFFFSDQKDIEEQMETDFAEKINEYRKSNFIYESRTNSYNKVLYFFDY